MQGRNLGTVTGIDHLEESTMQLHKLSNLDLVTESLMLMFDDWEVEVKSVDTGSGFLPRHAGNKARSTCLVELATIWDDDQDAVAISLMVEA